MVKYTPNYNLGMPEGTDMYSVLPQNANMDIIDTTLKSIETDASDSKTLITEHLTETFSESFYVMRNTELAGVQTITLPSSRTPKEIKINATVLQSKKISIGVWTQSGPLGGQQSLFLTEDQSAGTKGDATVIISERPDNFMGGKIQNVTKGSFEIDWTINGIVPSANIILLISVLYHGGV